MRRIVPTAVAFALVMLLPAPRLLAGALGTGITYQGLLKESGVAVNDTADFIFTLMDADIGGVQIGPTLNADDVGVVDGVFTVELDFGAGAFNSEARWLEIAVRSPAGSGAYTTLSPRQPVTAAPVALYALDGPGSAWNQSGSDLFYDAGNVGIGTSTPNWRLSVSSGGLNVFDDAGEGVWLTSDSLLFANATNEENVYQYLYGQDSHTFYTGGDTRLTINSSGNVGIGTGTPDTTLHVHKGSAGSVSGHGNAPLVVENSTNAYVNILSPEANERGVLFGDPVSNAAGGVMYNSVNTPNGLQFRTDGNVSRMVVDENGNVGIGTNSPSTNLHVRPATGIVSELLLDKPGGAQLAVTAWNSTASIGTVNDHHLRFIANDLVRMTVNSDGNVGVGTTLPAEKLHVEGNQLVDGLLTLRDASDQSGVELNPSESTYGGAELTMKNGVGVTTIKLDADTGSGALDFDSSTLEMFDDQATRIFLMDSATRDFDMYDGNGTLRTNVSPGSVTLRNSSGTQRISLSSGEPGGLLKMGPNTGSPATTTVEIHGDNTYGGGRVALFDSAGVQTAILDGERPGGGSAIQLFNGAGAETIVFDADQTDAAAITLRKADGVTTGIYLDADNNIGGSLIVTDVLQINGGSDLSERFDITGDIPIEPGHVTCIDPENPGQLVISTKAYDRKVAGIVSGAGGVKPGMLMGQRGTVADGERPVALTGRVWCQADASNGAIEPGDLLTTSDTPGHGMKATDYERARGAVIGKAMTALGEGTGLVLVLVQPQ